MSDEQRERLVAPNVVLLLSPSNVATETLGQPFQMPVTVQWVAFASGDTDAEANERVRAALTDDRFVAFAASLWTGGRLLLGSADGER